MRHRLAILPVIALAAVAAPLNSASAYTHKVLYSFCSEIVDDRCTDGADPEAALVMDSAGNLYGTTKSGGSLNAVRPNSGVVFELVPNAARTKWKYKVIHEFCTKANCADGSEPAASLILDTEGNLYGTTSDGGVNGGGTAFKLAPPEAGGHAWTLKVLTAFCAKDNCVDGDGPHRALTYAGAASGAPYDGLSPLYGTTEFGGASGQTGGTAFRLDLDQARGKWTKRVLYSFCHGSGCEPNLPQPSSALAVAGNGTLYGTVSNDGFPGSVFALIPKGGNHLKEKTVYTFCALANCADGEGPEGDMLTLDSSGNLYGTTFVGGPHGSAAHGGTIFQLDPAHSSLTTLYGFCALANCADGEYPRGDVVRSASGDLFGTASAGGDSSIAFQGGGTAFMLHDGAQQVLYSFCSETDCTDGMEPDAGLIMDGGGALYGTTSGGGANGGGTVFALVP